MNNHPTKVFRNIETGELVEPVTVLVQGERNTWRDLSWLDFQRKFSPVDPPPFRPTKVTGDWLPPEVVIDAFSNGQLWNGWLIPFFTREAALALREHMPELYYSEATDQFCLQGDDPQWCGATDLTIDGTVVKCYAIGDSYCWERADL
ncbi:hypothetical protein [Cupriavidus basilensis]